MAKRQQYSCPLRTMTLSLKFENVVPEGWIRFSFGLVQQEASTCYHMMHNLLFVVFCGTLLRPTAEGAVSIRLPPHPAKRSLAVCEHTGGVLGAFVVVFHGNICREHCLIGRPNCLMTQAANSLSAAAGPELPKARNISPV